MSLQAKRGNLVVYKAKMYDCEIATSFLLTAMTFTETVSSTLAKSTTPPLIAKTGIVWFGNHTRSNSTNIQRSRRSREFSFGYFSFAEKEK